MVAALTPEAKTIEQQSFDRLEREIVALSIRIHVATYELFVRIRRLDETTDWVSLGFRSCAHWLGWRVGLALGAARERVRVAHALAKLPQTSAAFQSGELSYSKARALTRTATKANEEVLLSIARYGTA